jgi:hypothetical protein
MLGAQASSPAGYGCSASRVTSRRGRLVRLRRLKCNQGQIVEGDENALIQASGSGRIGVAKLLVTRGADVNARAWSGGPNGEWRTALMMAKRNGQKEVFDFLLAMGARE